MIKLTHPTNLFPPLSIDFFQASIIPEFDFKSEIFILVILRHSRPLYSILRIALSSFRMLKQKRSGMPVVFCTGMPVIQRSGMLIIYFSGRLIHLKCKSVKSVCLNLFSQEYHLNYCHLQSTQINVIFIQEYKNDSNIYRI